MEFLESVWTYGKNPIFDFDSSPIYAYSAHLKPAGVSFSDSGLSQHWLWLGKLLEIPSLVICACRREEKVFFLSCSALLGFRLGFIKQDQKFESVIFLGPIPPYSHTCNEVKPQSHLQDLTNADVKIWNKLLDTHTLHAPWAIFLASLTQYVHPCKLIMTDARRQAFRQHKNVILFEYYSNNITAYYP